MNDEQQIIAAAERLAAAIGRRDVAAVEEFLAPGFLHRTHGGEVVTRDAFLDAIDTIPGEIEFVRLEQLHVDLTPGGALVTGIQHARVRVEAQTVNDRRRFVDWFVKVADRWCIQAAVDFPHQEPQ